MGKQILLESDHNINKKHFNPTSMLLYERSEHATIWILKIHHELLFILA